MSAPTARCPFCGITWAAWPGSSHSCSPIQNALGVTTGANPPDTPAAERLRRLEAVREAAERTEAYLRLAQDPAKCDACFNGLDGGHTSDCPIPALRAALDAVDAP